MANFFVDENNVGLSSLVRINRPFVGTDFASLEGEYVPSLKHIQLFVEMTGDKNPLHLGDDRVIAPGFLQTCSGKVVIDNLLEVLGRDLRDFPFFHIVSKMSCPIISGLDYLFNANCSVSNDRLFGNFRINHRNGNLVYCSEVEFLRHPPKLSWDDIGDVQYELKIGDGRSNGGISGFAHVINSTRPNDGLYALASSFRVIFDKVNVLDDKLPFYVDQTVVGNIGADLNPRSLKLEANICAEGRNRLGLYVLARNPEGDVLYRVETPISLLRKKHIAAFLERGLEGRV